MRMLFILALTLLLVVFTNTAYARPEPAPPEYSCQSDADCVTARAPCGEIRAVNRNYHDKIQAEWDRTAALVECAGLAVMPEDMPSCSNKMVCIMIPPTHPIQPDGAPHAQ